MRPIRRIAVLGSGVMGAAIAGHFANVGIPCLLLDIVPKELNPEEKAKGYSLSDKAVKNRLGNAGKAGLLKAKPAPLYDQSVAELIEVGNFEDDFFRIKDCDWIIEVVVENLTIKQQVFALVDEHRALGSVVSSNTSGVSIRDMSVGRSDDFLKHFLGTHFFNPPRYMKLLEIIPTKDTLSEVVSGIQEFAEVVLGKGVVVAKDTPNFIANRIGTYGLLVTLQEMIKNGFGVDEVDLLTGTVLGRPKSATFRTLDIVGLDTFIHVANNVYEVAKNPEEKAVFKVPDELMQMVEKGWIGEKRGQGFFKREKTEKGNEILALDLSTMSYRPRRKLSSASFEAARQAPNLKDKLKGLLYAQDQAGLFVWQVMKRVLLYSANMLGEIADSVTAIDDAMKWGFNWELGPFETWDAIGVERSVKRMLAEGDQVPDFVLQLANDKKSFYDHSKPGARVYFNGLGYEVALRDERKIDLAALKAQGKKIFGNSGASLIDIGDGIACLEFHSPKQAIGSDIISLMYKTADEVEKNFEALVIGSEEVNFSVGANLMLMLMEAQDENWDEINLVIRQFQNANMRMKYLKRPVVAAPFGLTLGGGAEVALSSHQIQAAAETYIGLVEVGVGLIPGGGGNKELLIRMQEGVSDGLDIPLTPILQRAFETIALAKVSTSAKEANKIGYLRDVDTVTVGRDYLLYEAKQKARQLAKTFTPAKSKGVKVQGENGAALLKIVVFGMKKSGFISEHDEKIAKHLIRVLTGGNAAGGSVVSEQYLLDLERESFLSLIGEPKTQARMQHMLQKGKPLRN